MTLAHSALDTSAVDMLAPTGAKLRLYAPGPLAADFVVLLSNNDMAPAYRKGDHVLVRGLRPGESVTPGGDYLFAQPDRGDGKRLVLLGHLTRATPTRWHCARYSDNNRRLSRAQWPTVYVVTGSYRTSNPALLAKAREGGGA